MIKFISQTVQRYIDLKISKKRLAPQHRLSYFVLNILDHCNLRCMGCDHFAALAEERFIQPDQIKRDLAQLSNLLSGDVERIGVMGGRTLASLPTQRDIKQHKIFFPEPSFIRSPMAFYCFGRTKRSGGFAANITSSLSIPNTRSILIIRR